MKVLVNYADYSDPEIWEALKRGSREAFTHLHQTYYSNLYNYGLRMAADEALVENCLQDMFITLWRIRESLGAVASIKSYLLASLRRAILKKRQPSEKKPTGFRSIPGRILSSLFPRKR